MLSAKVERKSWREEKQKRKKWKEEKMAKKLKKMEEKGSPVENVKNAKSAEQRTCSIAVPGSILDNAQSAELRTYLAGQIARAACIYKIDEVIVFDDQGLEPGGVGGMEPGVVGGMGGRGVRRCCTQFARILQYLECPQYLRKHFFPLHKDLEYAGLVNPLDSPHHLRQDEDCAFREGITTDQLTQTGTFVNVGLLRPVLINKSLPPGLRVTIKFDPKKNQETKKLHGTVVSPDEPKKENDLYWGYSVRIAHSLSEVFSQSPYQDGYDLTIGTSDKGLAVDKLKKTIFGDSKHCLVVFGGLEGLEAAVENDEAINESDPSLLFDHYINSCPEQGSRTIRTEEAVLITLAELRNKSLFAKFTNGIMVDHTCS